MTRENLFMKEVLIFKRCSHVVKNLRRYVLKTPSILSTPLNFIIGFLGIHLYLF